MSNLPEHTETVELLTLADALKRLQKRDFKSIAAHVELALPVQSEVEAGSASYFSTFTWVNLSRREAARFLRTAWSDSFGARGARIRFTLRHNRGFATLWIG